MVILNLSSDWQWKYWTSTHHSFGHKVPRIANCHNHSGLTGKKPPVESLHFGTKQGPWVCPQPAGGSNQALCFGSLAPGGRRRGGRGEFCKLSANNKWALAELCMRMRVLFGAGGGRQHKYDDSKHTPSSVGGKWRTAALLISSRIKWP